MDRARRSSCRSQLRDEFMKAHGPIAADRVHAERRLHARRCTRRSKAHAEADTAEAMAIADKTDRNTRARRDRGRRPSSALVGTDETPGALAERGERGQEGAFRSLQKEVVRSAHRQRGRAHRRSRPRRHPAAVGRGRRAPHRARLRPLPAGRDAGAVGHDARHAAHGADARHDHARRPQALHAPLQLPAVLHGRDGSGGFAEAPRDRSRRARRAGARPGGPDARSSGRTRCASSPTCSRRTAPRRWRRCAARRCR